MRVHRFWAKATVRAADRRGKETARDVWRGSDVSAEDAVAQAQTRADELKLEIASSRSDEYEYARCSKPEPLIDEVLDPQGERIGAVTINRYGASVLNTTALAFVDVDIAQPNALGRLFGRLMGSKKSTGARDRALNELRAWTGEGDVRGARGARVYETAAGLRYLLVHPAMDPASEETARLMKRLGADRRYAALCRAQRSFRARLTPKPWRIGLGAPPAIRFDSYPDDPQTKQWLDGYAAASRGYAVCRLIDELGRPALEEGTTTRLIELHDEQTSASQNMPLA